MSETICGGLQAVVTGLSAYQIALNNGFRGSEKEWLASLQGDNGGENGDSAYQIAVENGFVGTEVEWLASLQGKNGTDGTDGTNGINGESAYQIAVDNGYAGTEVEWLASLQGAAGKDGTNGTDGKDGTNGTNGESAYQIAVDNGYTGTEAEWLISLHGTNGTDGKDGTNGESAYQIAVDNGYTGTESEWLVSLQGKSGTDGTNGTNGESAYQIAVDNGYTGTETEWIASLKGANGTNGTDASVTATNIESALGYTPADPSKFLELSPSSTDDLPNIIAPSDSKFGSTYAFGVEDDSGNLVQVGCVSESGVNWFGIYSPAGHSTGIMISDFLGNMATLAGHASVDGANDLYSIWFAGNCEGQEGGFRIIDKDSTNCYWKFSCPDNSSKNTPWSIYAGKSDGSGWQAALVAFNNSTNTAEFLNEPVTTTTYTYATLPTSPKDWQRALVTDKAIGSGSQGVMAMYNPNTKTWTGLSGEALV